jgi:hypothetical protein
MQKAMTTTWYSETVKKIFVGCCHATSSFPYAQPATFATAQLRSAGAAGAEALVVVEALLSAAT